MRPGTDSDTVNLAVTGATGQMGRRIIETAVEHDSVGDVVGIKRTPSVNAVAGVPIRPASELTSTLNSHDVDVLVDFTWPKSSVEYVRTATSAGVDAVVGTTGFSQDGIDELKAAASDASVLKATNFAPGVQALVTAVSELAATLPGYDVEVIETYHNEKVDAPSGTVRTLLRAIEGVSGESEHVHGREGDAPVTEGEIGVHSRRAGDVVGENEVLFAGNHEVVTISQRAESRDVYAAGAIEAALSLPGHPSGWYTFTDVVGE